MTRELLVEPSAESIWRFSRNRSEVLPRQGWKLHISATANNAVEVLSRTGPVLAARGVLFKTVKSIDELKRLNCGLFYGFSQVGKFITVYPKNENEAVELAELLHNLTSGFNGPVVPYDRRLTPTSSVYYRYGVFGGSDVDAAAPTYLVTPTGETVPDERALENAVPDWIDNPFERFNRSLCAHHEQSQSLLSTTYRAYAALSQRGKGGVYEAIDLSCAPARRCILKEGRHSGEVDVRGIDGRQRILDEAEILNVLQKHGMSSPKIYCVFLEKSNAYIAMERINGRNLQEVLEESGKLPISTSVALAQEIIDFVARLHALGYVWRDCKPMNWIVDIDSCKARPIDFEGACSLADTSQEPWGSPGYIPPEWSSDQRTGRSRIEQDLFAVGATLHHLFSGTPPQGPQIRPIGSIRRGIPKSVRKSIGVLMSNAPSKRPDLFKIAEMFGASAGAG